MGETGRGVWALAAAVALAVAGCSGDDDDSDSGREASSPTTTTPAADSNVAFPGEEWDTASPDELGLDAAVLDDIAAEAEANGSACLLVARHGRVAGEWYWGGTDATTTHEAWSVTKSYTSTIVGIAQDEGLLAIDDPVADSVPAWVGTPSETVTIRNILRNDSGRRSTDATGGSDMALLASFVAAPDKTAFVAGLDQVAEPGTVWSNNEAAIQNLDPVIERATGQEPADYAREKLLDPIGATHTEMTKDQAGNTNMPAFLRTTCQDAARFGHLILQRGNWDGAQVVSEEWVTEATQPSQELNSGYGYLWWLNTDGAQPDAPEDVFWALGAFGQIIQVHPASGTVVVRLGEGDSITDIPTDLTVRVVTEAVSD